MKKLVSLTILALLMQVFLVNQTFAKTKEEKFAEQVKAGVAKLGMGSEAKVKLKLKDGTKIKGYVVQSNEYQFVVMDSESGKSFPVTYSNVKQIKGNNLSQGVKFAIILGAFIGFLVIIFAVYNAQGGG